MQPNQNMPGVGQPMGTTTPVVPAGPAKPVNPVSPARPVRPAEPAGGPTFDNGPSVVEGKGGKKTGWILGIVLCLILAAGGIGFGVWAWMDGNNQKDALSEQISSLKQQNNSLQEQLDNGNMAIGVDADADAWDYFSSNLTNQNVYAMGYYWHYNGTGNEPYVMYAMKDSDGHLTITDAGDNMSDSGSTILELDNVLMVYYIRVGNGSVPYFYIIDIEGEVSRIDISENSDRQLEKVGDYSKIVTVLETSLEATLVDIYGNVYKSA